MADEKTPAEEQAEALAADPVGGKPPIDIAHERAAEEAEPLGYVDPASQKAPDEPKADEPKSEPEPEQKPAAKKAAPSAVTRDDAKE
jgi:hypothetical protein